MSACPCGAAVCANHNRTWAYERSRVKPGRKVRAVVFLWPDRGFWTWCPVINGDPKDHGPAMGHFDSLQLAFAQARAWTRGESIEREAAA